MKIYFSEITREYREPILLFLIFILLVGDSEQASNAVVKQMTRINWVFMVNMLNARMVDN